MVLDKKPDNKLKNNISNQEIPKENVLSLREKIWKIEIDWTKIKNFIKYHKEGLLGSSILLVTIILIFAFTISTHALVTKFYPKSCLGGWENPSNAQGEPEVASGENSTVRFSKNNSAFLNKTDGDLFCGDFHGEIPENSNPKKLSLRFSILISQDEVKESIDTIIEDKKENTDSSTVDDGSGIPIDTQTDSTELESEPKQSTFLDKLTPKVFAQENTDTPPVDIEPAVVSPIEENAVTDTPPVEQPSIDINTQGQIPEVVEPNDIPQQELQAPASEIIQSFPDNNQDKSDTISNAGDILDVSYTFDGITWNNLGKINKNVLADLSFDVKLDSVNWDLISKMQIKVSGIPSIDTESFVYIDSMWFEVEYENTDILGAPPTIQTKDDSIGIISGDETFGIDEEPTFIITDPLLTMGEISSLVREDKLEVLKDDRGVITENNILEKDTTNTNDGFFKKINLFDSIDSIFSNKEVYDSKDNSNTILPLPDITIPAPDTIDSLLDDKKQTDTTSAIDTILDKKDNTESIDTILDNPINQEILNIPIPSVTPPVPDSPATESVPETNTDSAPPTTFLFKNIFSPNIAYADTPTVIEAVVLDVNDDVTDIAAVVSNVVVDGVEKQKVTVQKSAHQFRPGKYKLKVTLHTDNAIIVSEQDFSWGVLAINTDRSIYIPGSDAYIQMGVLNEYGHTICNAELDLTLTQPNGATSHFTTLDQSIIADTECGPDNVIEVPDYYAHYTVPNDIGSYTMTLTATTVNGPKTIVDHFQVLPYVNFDLKRKGPTRIYPVANYPVTIKINPTQNWSGIVKERVPASFGILHPQNSTDYTNVETTSNGKEKIISWNLDLVAGTETTIGYIFDAPDISPEFFLLGPITLEDNSGVAFVESRKWQIASDGVNRYWVGGTGTWDSSATTHWATCTGCASGASAPTAVDNVFIDGNSGTGTITPSGTVPMLDLDFTGYTGTFTPAGTIQLSGSLTLATGMTLTSAAIGWTLNATDSRTLTFNGKSFGSGFLTFNGVGGTWTFQDAYTSTANNTLTNGTIDTNGKTITIASLQSNNSNTRGITLGSSTINLTTSGGVWNVATTGLTFNAGTSTINCTSTSAIQFGVSSSHPMTFYDVNFTAVTATVNLIAAHTYHNLTLTQAAAKTGSVTLTANQTVTNLFTANGNSVANRLFVQSDTAGTTRTITSASVSITNADFLDITGAGAASPFTGTSVGSCGNNTNITGDTPTTRYWVGGTGNWADTSEWSASSGGSSGATAPLCHDSVIFNASSFSAGSQTVTVNMARLGGDINLTGITNTPTFSFGSNANMIFGSVTLVSGMTISGTQVLTLAPRTSVNFTSGTKILTMPVTIDAGGGGSVVLQDAFDNSGTTTNTLTLTSGTLDANNQNVKSTQFNSSNSNVRTLTMGSGTWTLSHGGVATFWSVATVTNLTLNANTSTIKFSEGTGSASAKTFAGGGLTYNNVWFSTAASGSSTYTLTITGSNTFNDFKWDRTDLTATNYIRFTAGITTTVNTFSVSGVDATHMVKLDSTTTATHNLVKIGGGVINRDFLNIQHSVATPASTWYAGTGSTNNQATATAGSGWTFTAAPAACVATGTGTWGGTDTANFTGCTGAATGGSGTGARPGAGDNLTINSGVTVTLATNTPALGSLAIDGTLDTSGTNYSVSTKNININSTGTLTANASTITNSATGGIAFYKHSSGTFNYGTSTVTFTGDGAFTSPNFITSTNATSFYNLTFSPTLSAARTYTFGSGAVTVNNNFDSNPSGGGSARALTTILGSGGMTIVGTFTLEGTSSGTSTFDTGSSLNYPLTFSTVNITSGDVLNTRGSAVSVTGTSGTLITNSGSWSTPVTPSVTTLSGNGTATINTGAITFFNLTSSGTGTKTLAASVTTTVSNVLTISAGTFALGAAGTLTLSGTTGTPFVNNATFSASTGTVTYTGNNASGNTTIETTNVTYYNLTLNITGETLVPNGNIVGDVAGTLTITLGTLDLDVSNNRSISFGKISIANSASAILLGRASTISLTATSGTLWTRVGTSAVFTPGTSTVDLTGNGSATINNAIASTFYNLTSSGTGTKTVGAVASSITVTNNLTVSNGTFDPTSTAGRVTGSGTNTLTVSNATILCPVIATTAFTDCYGSFETVTLDTGSVVDYSGSGAQTILNTLSYVGLKTSTSGTKVLQGTTTATGTVNIDTSSTLNTVSGSNYTLNAGSITITGTFTPQASAINVTGTSGTLMTRTGTFTAGTSTVTFSGNGAATATSGTFDTTNAFYNLTNSGTGTKTLGNSITVSNVLNITAGTFASSSFTITLSGTTGAPFTNSATFDAGTGTVTYTGNNAGGNTNILNTTYYNLTLNNSAETYILIGTGTVVDPAGTLTITNGILDSDNTNNYALSMGKLSIASVGTAEFRPRASTVSMTATSGTLITRGASGVFTPATSTFDLAGNGSATINSATLSFYNLTQSGTGVKTVGAAITINNNLTVSGGTFDPTASFLVTGSGTNVLTVNTGSTIRVGASTFGGNYTSFETRTMNTGSTVDYYVSGTQTVDSTLTYYNLSISVGGTKSLNGTTTANGATTVDTATLDTVNGSNFTLNSLTLVIQNSGTFRARASIITLSGTGSPVFTNNATFTADTSTIIFTGDGAPTLFSGTFTGASAPYNIELAPVLGADRVYSGGAIISPTNNFTIDPTSGVSSRTLTYNLGGANTITGTLLVQPGSIAVNAIVDTTSGGNYALTAGKIDLQTRATLVGNASTITLTGTSSTLFSLTGTGAFTSGTSTVVFNPNASVTLTSGALTFYNLSLTPTIVTSAKTYTFGSSTLNINGDFTINPTASTSLVLRVFSAADISVASTKTTTITGTTSGTSVLFLRPFSTDYNLTTGFINITSSGTLDASASASSITVNGASGTLFTNAGTFSAGFSTVIMNGNAALTLTSGAITFYNLNLTPTITSGRTYTFGSATINIDGDFNINPTASSALLLRVNMGGTITQATTKTTTITGTTSGTSELNTVSGSNYTLGAGNVTIASAGTLVANNSSITVGGSWSNAGTFTAGNSLVTLNTGATVTVGGGPTTFYDLTITHTTAKEVDFSTNALHIVHVTHTFTVTGHVAGLITLHSVSPSTQWHFHPTGTAVVDYANVQDSGCESGYITIYPTNTNNGLNNGPCWVFPIDISGTVYMSDETTTATTGNGGFCDGSTQNLTIRVNGANPITTSCSATTGNFSFGATVSAIADDVITIYSTDASQKANRVYLSDGTADSGIGVYIDVVSVSYFANGPVTMADLAVYDNTTNATDMMYDAVTGGSPSLTVNTNKELHVESGSDFTPGGTVNASRLHVIGTYHAGSDTINLTGTTGTLLTMDGAGTFDYGTSNVVMNPNSSSTLTSGVITLYDLNLTPTITTGRTYTFGSGAVSMAHDFNINPTAASALVLTVNSGSAVTVVGTTTITGTTSGTSVFDTTSGGNYALTSGKINIASAGTFTSNSSTITLNGTSSTLFTTSGTFNYNTSNVIFNPNASVTLISGAPTFYNLTFSPTVTVDRTYTIGSSSLSIINDFTLNTTSGGGYKLLVNMGNTLSIQGILTMQGSGTGLSEFDTTGSNYALTAGNIFILDGGILTVNDSDITLTDYYNSGNPLFQFDTGAVFNYGTSKVIMNPDHDAFLTTGYVEFYDLEISPSISSSSKTYTFGDLDTTIHNNFSLIPDLSLGLNLSVNLGAPLIVDTTGTTLISPTGSSGNLYLDTTSNNYPLTTGKLTIDNAWSLLTSNSSVITITGDSIPYNNNGGTFSSDTSTVVFNNPASSPLTPYYDSTGTISFYNLELSPFGPGGYANSSYILGTETLNIGNNFNIAGHYPYIDAGGFIVYMGGDISVGNDMEVTFTGLNFSTFYFNSNILNIDGDLNITSTGYVGPDTGPGNIFIGGNLTVNGSIDTGTSIVTFDSGNTSIISTPSTLTFYDLTITNPTTKIVQFPTSGTSIIEVTNDFNVAGASGQLIYLHSTSSGTKWHFNPTGTQTVDYASVRDGGCEVTADIITPTNSVDQGNNEFCWDMTKIITFDMSDASVGFGAISPASVRYADGTGAGSATEVEAHNFSVATNANGGYVVNVLGSSLSRVGGGGSISPMGNTNISPSAGSSQFGLRMVATGGAGSVTSPYDGSGFAYDGVSVPSEVARETVGDGIATTYSVRYVGNISPIVAAGEYTTTLTYIVTGTF